MAAVAVAVPAKASVGQAVKGRQPVVPVGPFLTATVLEPAVVAAERRP
jgi:hypothetical protein